MIYLSKKLIFSARRAFFLRFIAPPREEYTSRALLISRWKFEVHSARYLSSRGLRRPEGCDKWLWPREPRLRWPTVLPQNDDSYTLLVLLFHRRDLARKPWSVCTRYNYTSRYFILCEKRRIKGKMKVNRRIASSSFMYIEQEFTPGGQRVCIRHQSDSTSYTWILFTMNSRDPLLIISTTVQSGTKSSLPLPLADLLVTFCSLRDARITKCSSVYTRTCRMTYEP